MPNRDGAREKRKENVMSPAARLTATYGTDDRTVRVNRGDGSALLVHRVGEGQRPSIHPLYAPEGDGVYTQDSPAHHPWQHGLYTGFNLVNGIGFWKEQPGDGSFHPTLTFAPEVDGSTARWAVETLWKGPDSATLIIEGQEWALTDAGGTYDLDLGWSLQAMVNVEIGQFMAGGLFLRMPYAEAMGGVVLNSEGHRNGEAEKQRARWVAVSMPIAGRRDWGGVAIMDHPANPAFPVTWRVDNELGVSPSRCIAESWMIPVGMTERYRFRLHVFSGTIDPQDIEVRWSQFAEQAEPVP
jgi:hypothetical protein